MALQNVKKSVPMKVNKKSPTISHAKSDAIIAVGRRKTASVRIRLYRGKGVSMINDKPIAEYFSSVDPMGMFFLKPFQLTGTSSTVYVTAKVVGSGLRAQEDAFINGVAKALVLVDPSYRVVLRKAGLLTRDARMKESRKMGTGGKARREKQSPKR